jgi:hypothetical protein
MIGLGGHCLSRILLIISAAILGLWTPGLMPAVAQSLQVGCKKQVGHPLQSCWFDRYESVLQGKRGIQLRVGFPGGYFVEAFCFELKSGSCRVKSPSTGWEWGQLQRLTEHAGFANAFVISTMKGAVLAICDAQPRR